MDRRYLTMIADLYGGGPVGVETLAAGLSEPRDTIEEVIEPFLIQLGLIARTARGRCLNGRGYAHLGLAAAAGRPDRIVRSGRITEVMRHLLDCGSRLLLAAAAPLYAQPTRRSAAVDYSKDSNWLCLPGRGDTCSTPLATTALNPNGYGSVGQSSVAKDAPIDCFYVYPTVSRDQGMNSDMNAGPRGEVDDAKPSSHASPRVCRTFAPIYRQMTVAAVAAYSAGGDIGPAASARLSRRRSPPGATTSPRATTGRPFVLDRPQPGQPDAADADRAGDRERIPALAARMKLAILPGFNVLVPQGKLVGGTFKKTPLCSRAGETGCVISLEQLPREERSARRRDLRRLQTSPA